MKNAVADSLEFKLCVSASLIMTKHSLGDFKFYTFAAKICSKSHIYEVFMFLCIHCQKELQSYHERSLVLSCNIEMLLSVLANNQAGKSHWKKPAFFLAGWKIPVFFRMT